MWHFYPSVTVFFLLHHVSDFIKLFELLNQLQGNLDERCTYLQTVAREAERFKRVALAQKLFELMRTLRQSSSAFRQVGYSPTPSASAERRNSSSAGDRLFRPSFGRNSASCHYSDVDDG